LSEKDREVEAEEGIIIVRKRQGKLKLKKVSSFVKKRQGKLKLKKVSSLSEKDRVS